MPTKPSSKIDYSSQEVDNLGFDTEFGVGTSQPLGFDGVALQRALADSLATKITVSGDVTYVAVAAPGTAESSALWQCKKIDGSSGTVVTFADGDSNFDNVATDLSALTYS